MTAIFQARLLAPLSYFALCVGALFCLASARARGNDDLSPRRPNAADSLFAPAPTPLITPLSLTPNAILPRAVENGRLGERPQRPRRNAVESVRYLFPAEALAPLVAGEEREFALQFLNEYNEPVRANALQPTLTFVADNGEQRRLQALNVRLEADSEGRPLYVFRFRPLLRGTYRLEFLNPNGETANIETSAGGSIETSVGAMEASFLVRASAAATARFEHFPTLVTEGLCVSGATVSFYDAFGNPTDSGGGAIILRGAGGGGDSTVVGATPLADGRYRLTRLCFARAGETLTQARSLTDETLSSNWTRVLPLPSGAQTPKIVQRFAPTEFAFVAARPPGNPHTLSLTLECSHVEIGEKRVVAGFWDGENVYRARTFFPREGLWLVQSRSADEGAGGRERYVYVEPYQGDNPLFKKGRIRVADSKRTLSFGNGEPFFYLGDTAWEITWKSTLEQARRYVADRRAKEYSVVQIVATSHLDPRIVTNRNGERSYIGEGYDIPNPKFFWYLDTLVRLFNENRIIPAIVPIWGHMTQAQPSPWFDARTQLSIPQSLSFARYLASRYAGDCVFWIIGGDNYYETQQQQAFWASVAKAVQEAGGRDHLTTVHTAGYRSSLDYFDNSTPWIDFTMYQSSHVARGNSYPWQAAERVWNAQPTKPGINGECVYENIHDRLWEPGDTSQVETNRISDLDVRRASYESVLNGATVGVVYGANGIFQWSIPGNMGSWSPTVVTDTAWKFPASGQMTHLKRILTRYAWHHEMSPRRSIVAASEAISFIPALAGARGALVYFPDSTAFVELNLAGFGNQPVAAWHNPRTGDSLAATLRRASAPNRYRFEPPNSEDWVLGVRARTIHPAPPPEAFAPSLALRAYPNPARDIVAFMVEQVVEKETPSPLVENESAERAATEWKLTAVELIGANGRRVLETSAAPGQGLVADVSALPSGSYAARAQIIGLSGERRAVSATVIIRR
jgi:hypothetical protein